MPLRVVGLKGSLPMEMERVVSFLAGLLLSSCDVVGNHRWDAKINQVRKKHYKGLVFNHWVVCFNSSALADWGVGPWAERLGYKSRAVHLQEDFTSLASSVLDKTCVSATRLLCSWLNSLHRKSVVARSGTETPISMSTSGKVSKSLCDRSFFAAEEWCILKAVSL